MNIKDTKPVKRNILIKLPDYQKERQRVVGGGIYIPHMEGRFEHDTTHGVVVAIGEDVVDCQVGDEVFFATLCIQAGLQNMGRDKTRTENTQDRGSDVPVYYLADDTGHYLYMPENRMFITASDMSGDHEVDMHGGVICLIRNGELIALNDYHLIKDGYKKPELIDGVPSELVGGIYVAVLKEKPEKEKRYEVICAPKGSDINVGDLVFTQPHCDLKIEGDFNYPLLPKGTYYVHGNNILAVVE